MTLTDDLIHHAREIAGTVCTRFAGQYVNEVLKGLLEKIDSQKADLDEALDLLTPWYMHDFGGDASNPPDPIAIRDVLRKHGRLK